MYNIVQINMMVSCYNYCTNSLLFQCKTLLELRDSRVQLERPGLRSKTPYKYICSMKSSFQKALATTANLRMAFRTGILNHKIMDSNTASWTELTRPEAKFWSPVRQHSRATLSTMGIVCLHQLKRREHICFEWAVLEYIFFYMPGPHYAVLVFHMDQILKLLYILK